MRPQLLVPQTPQGVQLLTDSLTTSDLEDLLSSLSQEELESLDSLLMSPGQDFLSWLEEVNPTWTWRWKHLIYIQQHLQMVTDGTLRQLMLFVPPRHGKSEMTTVRYPVYRLEQDPKLRIIVGAYNQTLAEKFSRKARRIAFERYKDHKLPLNPQRLNVADWETLLGGGYRSVGVGGGITGQGGDLIIIDDPVKSRKEADSETYREWVYDWYTDDLFTRREPGAAMILIMTRWHEEDLAGMILESEDGPNWTVISLPALAEENDALGRKVGDALCPERYSREDLLRAKNVLQRTFYALYQQRPQPREGTLFKRHLWKYTGAVPAQATRVRFWDLASMEDKGDLTCGALLARWEGLYYVEDVKMGQWETAERNKVILDTARQDAADYGNVVNIWLEEEPGSAGKDRTRQLTSMLAGYHVRSERSTGSKTVRAEPFADQQEVGNVYLKKAPWNNRFVEILASFPSGKYDDPVDASSGAFNKLALGGVEYAPSVWKK